jgi:opacity protein-like surface antigen
MNTKSRFGNRARALVALLLAVASTNVLAQRESSGRAGTFEIGFQGTNISGDSYTGVNGAGIDVSNDTAFGVVGGYNFTDKFQVGAEMMWADPSYRVDRALADTGLISSVDAELDVATFILKAVYHFLDGPVTPYIEAGAGWVRVDSNIQEGPATTGCWWDPWWGYVCSTFYDTYSDTRTGYTYALGVRWDVNRDVVLRASYGKIDMDTNYAVENVSLDALRVELLWKIE